MVFLKIAGQKLGYACVTPRARGGFDVVNASASRFQNYSLCPRNFAGLKRNFPLRITLSSPP
jgi:hypothetical protein